MTTIEPICFKCKHFNAKSNTCPAFKGKKIPTEIIEGKNDHSKPLQSQGNMTVFESKIVESNDYFKKFHFCETCNWYLWNKKCFAFECIPEKYWVKMFMINIPIHRKPIEGQKGLYTYILSPNFMGIE